MRLLANWTIQHRGAERTIELLQGDLTNIPTEHAADILVVSAFANDYLPTPSSLIGALRQTGVSVAQLARSKQIDLRKDFSCWLSWPTTIGGRLVQVLCIESGWRGTPPEIADDLFRALAPASVLSFPNAVVAMPLIGAGDQGRRPEQMLEAILRSAVSWFRRGLALRALKIVVLSPAVGEVARARFLSLRAEDSAEAIRQNGASNQAFDIFLSYSHVDATLAQLAFETLMTTRPLTRVFYDRRSVASGSSWLMEVAESLDRAQWVLALYTPDYWQSHYCKDEFMAAFTRQHDTGRRVLYPVYLRSAQIPYLFRTIQHEDCREGDTDKLVIACQALSGTLSSSGNSSPRIQR